MSEIKPRAYMAGIVAVLVLGCSEPISPVVVAGHWSGVSANGDAIALDMTLTSDSVGGTAWVSGDSVGLVGVLDGVSLSLHTNPVPIWGWCELGDGPSDTPCVVGWDGPVWEFSGRVGPGEIDGEDSNGYLTLKRSNHPGVYR